MTVVLKRILIPCGDAIASAHTDVEACWYEFVGVARYLRLWVGRNKYKERYEDRDLGYQHVLTTPIAPISLAKTGFEAEIEHGDLAIRDLVQHLSRLQTSPDRRTHSPIAILDFASPEDEDYGLLSGEKYTVRLGRLFYPELRGSAIGWGNRNYADGFTLKFEEITKRRKA
jgi:hypothetical protein